MMTVKSRSSVFNNLLMLMFCAAIAVGTIASGFMINRIMKESCFDRLEESVSQGALNVRGTLENGEQQVQMAARMLADHTTLNEETASRYLDTLSVGQLFAGWSLMLPDGQMLFQEETEIRGYAAGSFEEEAARGFCLSERFQADDGGDYVVWAAPVVKEDTTVGILYGYVRLNGLEDHFALELFDGECQIYLVDGETGDALMDTWHDTLGNYYEEGARNPRKVKEGADFEQMKEDFQNERSGLAVFVSATTGEDFYTCYCPVGKEGLIFMVTVPYSAAFADSLQIRRVIYTVGVVELLLCVVYVLILIRSLNRQFRHNQKKLRLSHEVNAIQHILFGAYREPGRLTRAMERFTRALGAERTAFATIREDGVNEYFRWPVENRRQAPALSRDIQKEFWTVFENIPDVRGTLLDGKKEPEKLKKAADFLGIETGESPKNLLITWLKDVDGTAIGYICALDVQDPEMSLDAAETVAGSFLLALQLLESYRQLKRLGEVDTLTGLKNRNAYNRDLDRYETITERPFACIYMDANGLRGLNNCFGHTAGDALLRTIGERAQALFGFDMAYRLGGDEFLIFCEDKDAGWIEERLRRLKEQLEKEEYFVSTGWALRRPDESLAAAIERAEQEMYQCKQDFYQRMRERLAAGDVSERLAQIMRQERGIQYGTSGKETGKPGD